MQALTAGEHLLVAYKLPLRYFGSQDQGRRQDCGGRRGHSIEQVAAGAANEIPVLIGCHRATIRRRP